MSELNGHELLTDATPAQTVMLVPISHNDVVALIAAKAVLTAVQPIALAFDRDISAYTTVVDDIANRWLAEVGRPVREAASHE